MTTINSRFNRDANNWTISGDVQTFDILRADGHGQYLHWVDAPEGVDAYWRAPAKYTGDLSAFRQGVLSFDWYSTGNDYKTGDVIMTGADGTVLVADAPDPGADWTHATVKLSTGTWHIGTIDGEFATGQQLAAVLSHVTDLRIRAERVDGAEEGGLDNVALRSKSQSGPIADAFGADHHIASYNASIDAHYPVDVVHLALA